MSNVSNVVRKQALAKAVEEMVSAWIQADAQNEHAKAVASHIQEEYEIDKALVTKMAKIRYKRNLSLLKAKNDEVVELYEEVFGEDAE